MSGQLLVPLDGSSLAESAIPIAVEIARRLDLELTLIRVQSPVGVLPYPPEMPIYMPEMELEERVREVSESWLRERAAEVERTSGLCVSAVLRVGDPASEIVSAAAALGARAIVCTTHGVGGVAPHWIGSVADAIVRHAPCPVLALPPQALARSDATRTVLVLLDGSEVSDAILPHAEWLARAFDADLELFSVVAPGRLDDSLESADADRFGIGAHAKEVKSRLDTLVADLRAKGLRARCAVQLGASPARTILAYVAHTNPDMLALATYGRGLSRLFLGSVADKVLRSSGRPTLMLRPSVTPAAAAGDTAGSHTSAVEFVGGL
jgi:nucleotide-binding universal stress UspA family protein